MTPIKSQNQRKGSTRAENESERCARIDDVAAVPRLNGKLAKPRTAMASGIPDGAWTPALKHAHIARDEDSEPDQVMVHSRRLGVVEYWLHEDEEHIDQINVGSPAQFLAKKHWHFRCASAAVR